MSLFKKKWLIFFEFVSYILIITTYILYTVQSFLNHNFVNNNTKSISIERDLYENFSQEIYSNIKTKPINKIKNSTKGESFIETYFKSFYDCRGINNALLNEDKCQNKKVPYSLCCKKECCYKENTNTICSNYNLNTKNILLNKNILTYNDDEIMDDPRRRYCKLINQFSGNTSRIMNYYLKKELFDYSYEEIMMNKDNINENIIINKEGKNNFIDCGEIDSLKNHLFVKNIECPINYIILEEDTNELFFASITKTSLGIIVNNYLSQIPPLIKLWENILEKNEEVTIKEIKDLLNIKDKDNSDYNNYYKKHHVTLNKTQIPDFSSDINTYTKIYWYTTNYIGFETKDDLEDFISIFDEDDRKDNPLYKIRDSLFPSIGSSVICIILILFFLFCLGKYAYEIKNHLFLKMAIFKIKETIILITFIGYFIIYLVVTQSTFKKININIDPNYNAIIDMYNERRKQKCFLAGIILHFIVTAFEVFYFFYAEEKQEINKLYDIKNINKNDSTIINNNLSNTAEQIDRNVEIMQNSAARMKELLKYSSGPEEKINKIIKFEPY